MFNSRGVEPAFAVTKRQDREISAVHAGNDPDNWAPMEPVAPPSDITVAAIALLPVWTAAAWVIYTLLR